MVTLAVSAAVTRSMAVGSDKVTVKVSDSSKWPPRPLWKVSTVVMRSACRRRALLKVNSRLAAVKSVDSTAVSPDSTLVAMRATADQSAISIGTVDGGVVITAVTDTDSPSLTLYDSASSSMTIGSESVMTTVASGPKVTAPARREKVASMRMLRVRVSASSGMRSLVTVKVVQPVRNSPRCGSWLVAMENSPTPALPAVATNCTTTWVAPRSVTPSGSSVMPTQMKWLVDGVAVRSLSLDSATLKVVTGTVGAADSTKDTVMGIGVSLAAMTAVMLAVER